MEKLIELFNEYERPQTNHIYTAYEVKENMNRLDILQEFIKWLVDNDKIDLYKVSGHKDEIYYKEYGEGGFTCSDDELVIMLLSIQSEPLQFLISILK